ncbi:MAG: glycosyltransferase [Deltaproteobacteria bacterium]|nr:glycosyltransferase [Deltaproteobacteria bacterium]
MPRVSVIIPTHNRKDFLLEAMDSVFAQTYGDFELVVVDDGSTDGTGEALKRYGDRLIYTYQANQGVSAARNRGIELVRGEFIAFLDSDDLWLPKKLQMQVAFMDQHPEAQICYTDEIWIRRGVRVNPKKKHAKYSGWIYSHCLPLCIISLSSALMRRGLFAQVGAFDPRLPVCEDYDLWLRVASRFPVFLIPQRLIVKRGGHANQLSQRSWGTDRYRVIALVKILEMGVLTPQMRGLTIQELHRKCRILINGYLKRGKEEEVKDYQEVLKKYPL